jgi:Putative  PD-(D/E)XK family member, (DUF4420)
MSISPEDARHLTLTTLDELWNNGAPVELPIKGDPACWLQLDPGRALIALVTLHGTPEPDVASLKNVGFRTFASGGLDLAEITVRVEGNIHGPYGLLATIADELQIGKTPLAGAVASGVARHRDMLAARGALAAEQEIGLFGELLFLKFLIHQIGAGPAVAAWQGTFSEEHDFAFGAIHIEVKTTIRERRVHVIHGLTQLVPLHGVPLSLLSIQLTRSSPAGGRSLPQIVAQTRSIAGGHHVTIDKMLNRFGWHAEDADLYPTYWVLRSRPRAYAVTGDFPVMTPDIIGPVVANFGLLSEVTYRVDLTDLGYDPLPDPLAGFDKPKET